MKPLNSIGNLVCTDLSVLSFHAFHVCLTFDPLKVSEGNPWLCILLLKEPWCNVFWHEGKQSGGTTEKVRRAHILLRNSLLFVGLVFVFLSSFMFGFPHVILEWIWIYPGFTKESPTVIGVYILLKVMQASSVCKEMSAEQRRKQKKK